MAPGPGGRWGDPQKHLNLQPISNKDLQQAFLNAQKLDVRSIQQLKAMVFYSTSYKSLCTLASISSSNIITQSW